VAKSAALPFRNPILESEDRSMDQELFSVAADASLILWALLHRTQIGVVHFGTRVPARLQGM
jgi:hypothetical protein